MFDTSSHFFSALGGALVGSLWQMAMLWLIWQLIMLSFPGFRPTLRSHLATTFLLTGFGWFLFSFLERWLFSHSRFPGIIEIPVTGNGSLFFDTVQTIFPVFAIIYLLLLLFPVIGFLKNYRYVQTIRTIELTKAPVEWRMFVSNVAAHLGIRKTVRLWVSGLISSPVTVGYLKPVILLPVSAIAQLTPRQLEAVLLHELAHIRRYDYFFNLLIRLVQTVLYFNPFVTAFVKMIEREREKSCDEMVIQFEYDPQGYARALLTLEKAQLAFQPLAVAASGRKSDLLHRIEWMLGVKKKSFTINRVAGVVAGLLGFICIYSVLWLSQSPTTSAGEPVIADLGSPLQFLAGDESRPAATASTKRKSNSGLLPTTDKVLTTESVAPAAGAFPDEDAALLSTSPLAFASLAQTYSIELKKYQEEQVRKAVEESKKLIGEKQWQKVETEIADAFSEEEKEVLKKRYEQQLNQMNWDKMKDQLRNSYEQIDWTEVNARLGQAISELRMDSLQQAYNRSLNSLDQLQKQLKENGLTGIPDTDVTLQSVEASKKALQRVLNELKIAKKKKVVRL